MSTVLETLFGPPLPTPASLEPLQPMLPKAPPVEGGPTAAPLFEQNHREGRGAHSAHKEGEKVMFMLLLFLTYYNIGFRFFQPAVAQSAVMAFVWLLSV